MPEKGTYLAASGAPSVLISPARWHCHLLKPKIMKQAKNVGKAVRRMTSVKNPACLDTRTMPSCVRSTNGAPIRILLTDVEKLVI